MAEDAVAAQARLIEKVASDLFGGQWHHALGRACGKHWSEIEEMFDPAGGGAGGGWQHVLLSVCDDEREKCNGQIRAAMGRRLAVLVAANLIRNCDELPPPAAPKPAQKRVTKPLTLKQTEAMYRRIGRKMGMDLRLPSEKKNVDA